jgi:hypothetical protein
MDEIILSAFVAGKEKPTTVLEVWDEMWVRT